VLPPLALLLLCAAFAAAAPYGNGMYPFMGVLVALFARQITGGHAALLLCGVGIALLGVILQPPFSAICIMMLCTAPLFMVGYAFERLSAAHEQLAGRAEENERLRTQLGGQRKMTAALEHAARLGERNRLAARIHDEVGHGVSGSVLLLEGARLAMDKDPKKAKAAMEAATENLRAAVDDIRAALRQERAEPGEAGLAQISAQLTQFEARHPAIRTALATEGDLGGIAPLVWVCVQENLTETLTNLLKHSNARNFSVSITLRSHLVRVNFRDDGTAGHFTPGLGLAAMEERCALCHGNCFFSAGPRGFSTVMTFTYSNTYAKGGAPD
jgi:signal transduction histidine kinase